MPVPFVDRRLAVQLSRARPLRELDRLRAEAHRAAEILDPLLLGEKVDDRERRLGIHLRRVRTLEPDDVPRELRHRDVHPEADPEIRDLAFARDAAREDLPLPAARTEPSGDEHAVDFLEQVDRLLERHVLGVDPAEVDLGAVLETRVL